MLGFEDDAVLREIRTSRATRGAIESQSREGETQYRAPTYIARRKCGAPGRPSPAGALGMHVLV